ncbi:MAG: helix-turn-helix domain-containing protein [Chloroflexota bacterium]|nr:helix-turn-helix domain-containing protein [Chloroflexota bacterium]
MELDPLKLRQARLAQYLTQAQLAEKIGSSYSNISRLEANTRLVRLSTITRLADALGVSPDDLVARGHEKAASED